MRKIDSEKRRERDPLVVKRQQVLTGHHDLDLNRSESVRSPLGRALHRDIAAKREVDGLRVGADARRAFERVLGNPERVDQLVAAGLAERGVDPEEAPLGAQRGNPFSVAGGEPGEYLGHDFSDYGRRRTVAQSDHMRCVTTAHPARTHTVGMDTATTTAADRAADASMPDTAAAPSPFTPIANYGFLSNCHTGALVAPDGTVDWLCVPRFDSPSVFGALLDRGAGGFRFGPFGINVPSDRIYEPGTNTVVTSWKTPTGWVVVRDALTMGPRRGEDTVTPHTRPPSDEDADHALVRTAKCIDGSVEIDLVCEPAFDYGRVPGEWTLSPDRHRADATGGDQALRLQTDMLVGIEAGRARARHVLRAGETVYCALPGATKRSVPSTADEAAGQLDATTRFWRDWLARAAIPDHELGPMIQRSALTIKGLTYMPTGATVAALTTSLPETPAGERNWDYRYTWIRDSTFLLRALHSCSWIGRPTSSCSSWPTSTATTTAVSRSCTASTVAAI